MHYLDRTLDSPAANLALDEALLDQCEDGGSEVLRFWESPEYFVVLGYANQVEIEANVPACRERNVPILRRCSGGGTVLQGPGCLNYSLVLNFENNPKLQTIPGANCQIMKRNAEALRTACGLDAEVCGITDLAVGALKFSGNAQRRKRRALIFHGTFLLTFNLQLVSELLRSPSKEPEYRAGRAHGKFIMNLHVDAALIRKALRSAWGANDELQAVPDITTLVQEKYSTDEWNLKF
ncbi:MAG: lipoate--protein ligase family protein [Limisphaerales bacterium]